MLQYYFKKIIFLVYLYEPDPGGHILLKL